jgi:hypothetical protein
MSEIIWNFFIGVCIGYTGVDLMIKMINIINLNKEINLIKKNLINLKKDNKILLDLKSNKK